MTNAVVPEIMRQGGGHIINVTTSLGSMIHAGFPTCGPSKSAPEALSAIMAKDLDGTGVTVNVLVPGGATNTPMISNEAGFDRAKLIQPEVVVPPLLWLVTNHLPGADCCNCSGVPFRDDAPAGEAVVVIDTQKPDNGIPMSTYSLPG
jgi:NAD(P)-dependent dehydrogenase (short-subunit alcohol dehydrogenase family)